MTTRERLAAHLQKRENQVCADCKSADVTYFDSSKGIFICQNCAEIHRTVFRSIFPIISINDRSINEQHFRLMERIGNQVSNEYYECEINPEDRPERGNFDLMRQFIIDKYRNKRWANIREYPPSSFRRLFFGKRRIIMHIIDIFQMIFDYLYLLSLIILILCIKYSKVLTVTAFSLIIATEIYNATKPIDNIIGLNSIIQIILAMLGFGVFKGILTAISIKSIAIGIQLGGKACYLFILAAILLAIGYGFENMVASAISFISLFTCAYIYFDMVQRGEVTYFGDRNHH